MSDSGGLWPDAGWDATDPTSGRHYRAPPRCGTMTRMNQCLTPSSTLRQVIIIS